ncbi:MAG: hypothetical protein G01um101417_319 [Parcubacteria group bacterium Gr01-1014_17]|nr:MAG: hypothetical protein G01um101417_319 [Parcubacteria group bacterium Gr01-1014_17]
MQNIHYGVLQCYGMKKPHWSCWRHLNYLFYQQHLSGLRGTLLDVGVGKRHLKNLFTGFNYKGVDWAGDADVLCDLNAEWPFQKEKFDVIICSNTLEHIKNPHFLAENMLKSLRGTLLGTVPYITKLHQEPHDYFRYTPYALMDLLEGVKIYPLGSAIDALHLIRKKVAHDMQPIFKNRLWHFVNKLTDRIEPKLDPSWQMPLGYWFMVKK